jgi:hypothetical protein
LLKTLKNELLSLQMPIDYTIYEVKKEALRTALRSHLVLGNNLEVFVNRQKVADWTLKVIEVARDRREII